MTAAGQTPSQTVGPFFHDALLRDDQTVLDPDDVAGAPAHIRGQVRDGAGDPVSDAMVEVWQADGEGRYRHPADPRAEEVPGSFLGFGRSATDEEGMYRLRTVLPGPVAGPDGTTQAPHLNVHVFARGLLDQLWTRIYLPDHPLLDSDPLLAAIPAARRSTLMAQPEGEDGGAPAYRFDIVLQGDGETVFFQG